jgi:hypothetical protein
MVFSCDQRAKNMPECGVAPSFYYTWGVKRFWVGVNGQQQEQKQNTGVLRSAQDDKVFGSDEGERATATAKTKCGGLSTALRSGRDDGVLGEGEQTTAKARAGGERCAFPTHSPIRRAQDGAPRGLWWVEEVRSPSCLHPTLRQVLRRMGHPRSWGWLKRTSNGKYRLASRYGGKCGAEFD